MRSEYYIIEIFNSDGVSLGIRKNGNKIDSIWRANNLTEGRYATINEVVSDGEDIISNKLIYDGSDK